MARFIYDVDKITRYIDIHKQFQGGLKTVDTDDALKDIYLREAENVSLSEFNFIEKRYGLHKLKEHSPWVSLESTSSIVQGYFEYYVDSNTVHKLIMIEGYFYIDQGSGFEKITELNVEDKSVDLSSLGIFVNTDATQFSSYPGFGDQVPWFYIGSPNGVVMGKQGDYIHSNNGTVYVNYGGENLNTLWTGVAGVTFPFPSGLIYNDFYLDTRTNKYYRWDNPTGIVGALTFVSDVLTSEFQSTRPIEGVRIDNKLYIATGTYPVYYKGDGKIYVFPQYQMSDLDIEELGYDLNNLDLEATFNIPELPENTSQGNNLDGTVVNLGNTIIVKQQQHNPKLPFLGSSIKFQIAYHLYNNSAGTFWDTGFDSTGGLTTVNSGTYGTYTTTSPFIVTVDKSEFRLYPKVYKKRPNETSYTQVPSANLQYVILTNDKNTAVTSTSTFDPLPLTSAAALSNMEVTVSGLESGIWDYRVDMIIEKTGFTPTFSVSAVPTVVSGVYFTRSVEFSNINITTEELVDYKEAPYDTLKVHTCNRIIEHNGRLGLFGSLTHPDYVFFSTISAKEYFPFRYSLQFSNDLSEPVTTINRFMNILVVQTPSFTFGIKGDSPFPLSAAEGDIYRKITINPTIGCIAPNSVKNVRNQLFFLSKEGIFTLRALYAEDNRYNVDPIDRNIYNIVPRDANAVSAYFDDQYWLHFPNTGETLRYYVDKRAWVKDTYAAWNIFGGVHKYINENGKLRFITELSQLENGSVTRIFDIEVDYSLPTDLTKNITSKITTSYLNQNQPFHPKNYKEAKFDFAIQNEYNTSNQELPIANYAETVNYVQFTASLIDRHFYSITFEPDEIGVRPAAYTVEIDAVQVASGNITETNGNLSTIRFMSNKTGNVLVKITSTGKIVTANMSADSIKLYDSTYDHTVTFNTMVLSEEGTLNIDPIESYTSADVAIPINLGTRTGNWTFGNSNFGNVIVAVKTVKLSGRGYNSKVSVIEDSKSKWTLESLGITYKMKKARSR